MKKSHRKPLKEKSSYKCYNKSHNNSSERNKGRAKLNVCLAYKVYGVFRITRFYFNNFWNNETFFENVRL